MEGSGFLFLSDDGLIKQWSVSISLPPQAEQMGILLVIAHPDDECMFFTPSVRYFRNRGDRVDLLCLSTGNFDGMGPVRRGELEKSAAVLGINSVTIIDDSY